MHKFLLTSLLASAALTISAAEPLAGFAYGDVPAPEGTEWENPEALALNKEQPHAYFFNFASTESALKVLPENSEYYKSLDGTWKFNWVNHPEKRPQDFYKTDFNATAWDDIQVPGCWNIQGLQKDGTQKYGTPIYVNQPVPFYHEVKVDDWRHGVMREPKDPNWTTYKDRNEVGSYRRTFTIPEEWKDREVFINFDGVDSFFYLWINGKYVGFSKNSRNLAQFNITKYLNPKGENVVAVEVYRYSDGSFLETQDMFRLPGIIRSTYLTATPKVQIQDLVVRTTIAEDANPLGAVDAEVSIDVTLRNLSKKSLKAASVQYGIYPVKLYSDDTEAIVCEETSSVIKELKAGNQTSLNTTFTLKNAKLWSAETPNRYVLVARLLDKKGKVLETVSTYFGVRHVEIRDTPAEKDEFGLAGRYYYINNRTVKLKGVNRHENNMETGHTLSREQMENEVMLMKQGNINHVRNSHYPDDPYWYYVCDKYGIYLEDEANLESHQYYYGKESLSHPKEWEKAHIARNMEMVHANVNHPSIVIWSLGNEAGPGNNFVSAYNAIKAFDTSRPVQYERNNDIVDMGSNQYPSIPWVQVAVTGTMGIKYPFHISEYAHSMGNALGNFKDYWDAIESTNFLCGGAIWDWVDQGFWNYTSDGTKYRAYGGDFGDTPNSGMFCMNGIMFSDFTPKPQYHEVKKVQQYVGVKPIDMSKGLVEIFNKNYFVTLDDYSPIWILTKDGKEVARGNDVERPRMSIAPRSSQTWRIPYDFSSLDSDGEYFVTLQFLLNEDKPWAKKGYVQAEEQLLVKSPEAYTPIAANGKVTLTQGADINLVSGEGWNAEFNNLTGTINSLTYNGKQFITPGNGPKLDALRAPTDNDNWARGQWFANGLNDLRHKVIDQKAFERPDGAVVLQYTVESQSPCAYTLQGGDSGKNSIVPGREFGPNDFKFTTNQIWTIYPDGSIELQSAINSNKPGLYLARIGYAMTLPKDVDQYTYYGRGPVNNYNDRCTAQNVAIYNSTVADQFVHFPKPQSMGNREDIRWNAITDAKGNGLMFIPTDGTMSASALPWTALEMTLAPHPYQLPASSGTQLHLDAKVNGLGGNSCGQGGPLTPDRVKADARNFGFIIRPVKAGDNMQELAKVSGNGIMPLGVTRDRTGKVTIFSANPEAKIMYRFIPTGMKINKGRNRKLPEAQYTEPVNTIEGGTLTVWDAAAPEIINTYVFEKIESIPVEVIFASAEEPGENASNLVDNDPTTIWHTTYGKTVALYPHWVDFDCGSEKSVKGFIYQPRQDGDNGDIKDWKIEVSSDAQNWTEVSKGTFARNKTEKRVEFAPVKARYVRFTGLNSQNGADFASGAEFIILAD